MSTDTTNSLRQILVVDDNEDSARLLAILIGAGGYRTHTVFSPEEAFEAVKSFKPDAALLDLGLPGMSGHELGQGLREVHPDLFLIAVSGYGQPDDINRSTEAGFDRHFVKPVDHEEILKALSDRFDPKS